MLWVQSLGTVRCGTVQSATFRPSIKPTPVAGRSLLAAAGGRDGGDWANSCTVCIYVAATFVCTLGSCLSDERLAYTSLAAFSTPTSVFRK